MAERADGSLISDQPKHWKRASGGRVIRIAGDPGFGGLAWLNRERAAGFGVSLWPLDLYRLRSVLRLDDVPRDATPAAGAVLINTIPKAGTYFVSAALARAGLRSAGLHLGDPDIVDDYRFVPPDELHRDPHAVRLRIPLEYATAILRGEHVVGHVHDETATARMAANGLVSLPVVRDLRDVLVSMFRFKLRKVAARDRADELWRKAPTESRFLAFLEYFDGTDVELVRRMAIFMADRPPGSLLRFEDLHAGRVDAAAADVLDGVRPGLATAFADSILSCRDVPTSTFSGMRTEHARVWNADAERVFARKGLVELNRALGYG